ncbi:hypothetical protein BU17DRAFT_83439 [Hysterangium stoloniferum]|nr:hypothetical protein BU17DRAFT_83439 [Hysterangium stoloniferum]
MFTHKLTTLLVGILISSPLARSTRENNTLWNSPDWSVERQLALSAPSNSDCFNCLIPKFTCGQFGTCNPYDGQCKCPAGWGGIDCLLPQCGSLADGDERYPRQDDKPCECKDGWEGINCNVCTTDRSCEGFPIGLPTSPDDDGTASNMTCYRNGATVIQNHQMCNVTNRKILDMLPDRPPQVTFSCDNPSSTCQFQFWIGQVESFYCALDTCDIGLDVGYDKNVTKYECQNIKCSCIPGRMLCGESGSIDIGDFLSSEIKGPATFSCTTGQGCKFVEPAMNQLITQFFGDGYISLTCDGGECLHYTQVPGYTRPAKPNRTVWMALSAAGAGLIFLVASAGLWYLGRARSDSFGQIRLPETESAKLMTDHVPASLHFSSISYSLGSHVILDGITGHVKPGQVLAIMGASGAGKSTFLDILARRNKKGLVTGTTLVNGRVVRDEEFRKVVGFVDQEDTLMSTLTVYETVLYSALLRLPRDMSLAAKKFRTLETMQELGILGIKDSRIGDTGNRSISGGEKRRVSIACELVTSPSILFLDEPTSGLDAYNAFNVVECLVTLARNYNRTVLFTIHQPRSNIVSVFDQLILLAQGKLIYSGGMDECQSYFKSIGHPCPPGFNIADFLIDLTMRHDTESSSPRTPSPISDPVLSNTQNTDEERVVGLQTDPSHRQAARSLMASSANSETADEEETELQIRRSSTPDIAASSGNFIKRKTSQLIQAVSGTSRASTPISPQISSLVDAFGSSTLASAIRTEINELSQIANQAQQGLNNPGQLPDVAAENTMLRGHHRASWATQFRILSGRAFKNLYRDPALLAAHYLSSIGIALIAGYLFYNVGNDLRGFQNRMGLFFFSLALFGFSCLSSLGLFANERILFMRERANGYYSSFTYFASKILFDIVPLRVVPPLVFGSILYGLVGLVPSVLAFWKFLLTLVLFNLTTASVVLLISVAFSSTGVAGLVGTLIMLYNLLFTGLLINRDSVGPALSWLHTISFFHAGFEALCVNELRYLQLKETKYGVEIDVPAATILYLFGLRAESFWWPNMALLCLMFGTFTVISYLLLHFYVRERR